MGEKPNLCTFVRNGQINNLHVLIDKYFSVSRTKIILWDPAQGGIAQPRASKPKGVRWNLGEEVYGSLAPQTEGVAKKAQSKGGATPNKYKAPIQHTQEINCWEEEVK